MNLERKLKLIEHLNKKPKNTDELIATLRTETTGTGRKKKKLFPTGDDGWTDKQLLTQCREVRNKALLLGALVESIPPKPPAEKTKTLAEKEKEAFEALARMTADDKKRFKEDIAKAKATAEKRKAAAAKARAKRQAKREGSSKEEKKN